MSLVGVEGKLPKTTNLEEDTSHFCKRTSSGLIVGESSLYPVIENENEAPALPANQSKPSNVKRRSYVVNALYKNVMNKRNSAIVMNMGNQGNTRLDSTERSRKNSRPGSLTSLNSSISVMVNTDNPGQQKYRNPIDHYEQNMNFALRPKSSSIADLASLKRRSLPNRSQSGANLKYLPSKTKESRGSRLSNCKDFQFIENCEGNSSDKNVSDEDLISKTIANALNDDILPREITFDNKWTDDSKIDNFADHVSHTSSNQSPLTKVSGQNTYSESISRRDSIILEDFQKDLGLSRDTSRLPSDELISKNPSRLQLKMNTMKMMCDRLYDAKGPLDATTNDYTYIANRENELKNSPLKCWQTNTDVKTKLLSEKISRELQSVKRAVSHEYTINGKLVSTRFIKVLENDQLRHGKKDASTSLNSNLPSLVAYDRRQSDVLFSRYFESIKSDQRTQDHFREKITQTIADKKLKESFLSARDYTSKMWSEFENSEFS